MTESTAKLPSNRQVENVIFPELSYRLMGIFYEVHNQLGPGFSEDIYERAVVRELSLQSIRYEEQKVIPVCYKGELMGSYRLDLIVEDKIIVELKAVSELNDLFRAQLLSYLKATGYKLGLLVNFGAKKVVCTRVVN